MQYKKAIDSAFLKYLLIPSSAGAVVLSVASVWAGMSGLATTFCFLLILAASGFQTRREIYRFSEEERVRRESQIAEVSHDLRTPINNSMIHAQLLIENVGETLTPAQVRQATAILSANHALMEMIERDLEGSLTARNGTPRSWH